MSEVGPTSQPNSYTELFCDDDLAFLLGSDEPNSPHIGVLTKIWREERQNERPQYPARLDSGQVLWIRPDGDRTEEGYRNIDVFDKPPRSYEAVLAALTLLEVESPPVRWQLQNALESLKSPPAEELDSHVDSRTEDDTFGAEQTQGGDFQSLPVDQLRALKYALTLLRYYRPNFDRLPSNEQRHLILGTCIRIHDFMESLHSLMASVEYGTPSGNPNKIVDARFATRDIKASLLKDVDGLSYPEVGRRLGLTRSWHDENKNDHEGARRMVRRGREYLKRALGEDGWRQQIEAMKAESEEHRARQGE